MEVISQSHTPAFLPLEKDPLVPIGWEAMWPPELVCVLWRREKSPALARN
jgi:hypothetical protein